MSARTWITGATIAVLLVPRPASALEPKTRIAQYRHTAWRVQDGAFESAPNAIAQTADGYIWIGTGSGLVRFDGVRFQRWTLGSDKRVFDTAVVSLLGASDGTLWIGTDTGLLSWKNDHLQEHVSGRIGAILEDHQHRIWVARSRMLRARDLGVPTALSGGLCQVVGDHTGCIGGDDRMRLFTADVLSEDVEGNLWIGAPNQLMRLRDGSFDQYLREQLEGPPGSSRVPYVQSTSSIAVAADGSVWAAIPRETLGVFRVVRGLPARASFRGIDMAAVTTVFIDRDHSLWMGTRAEGVYRVAGQRVDHFRSEHGLSSNVVNGFFEDREGNIWVATSRGLDLFAESPVVAFSTTNEFAAATVQAVLASDDGTVWIGGAGSLDALRGDKVTSIRMPGRSLTSLWRDQVGRLWVGNDYGLSVYDHGRFRAIYRPDGSPLGMVAAIAEDRDDNVWVSVDVGSERKLFRIRDLRVQEEFAPDRIPLVRRIAPDPTGGIWLGFEDGNLGHYQSGKLEIFPLPHGASAPGSHRTLTNAEIGYVGLTIDADGSAWVSTLSGLVRWKNHEMKALTSKNGLPCDAIVSAIRDDQATLWLYTKCGFVAVTDAELEQWWQQPDRIVDVRVLDVFDGAVLPAGPRRFQPAVSKSPDGRLWFVNGVVLQMIDPGGLRKNRIPPPVYVEDVRADRKDYATGGLVRLPARSRDIEIGYSALSFSTPQKVRFRHKLEGRDQEWQDAGSRRQVFYSDLPPRHYRFRVMASNNEGVWNEAGASVDFSIAPAYYQTAWFRTGIVVAALTLVWGLYQLRVRQLAHQFDTRLQERLNERTRIARELHDTLLQSFHGIMFRLQAVRNMLPARTDEAIQTLDTAILTTEQAIAESRDAIQDLRSAPSVQRDLGQALATFAKELGDPETKPRISRLFG